MFVWSVIYLLFALVAREFYGSLAEMQKGDRCGAFCLTVLKPLIDHIAMHQQQWNNYLDVLEKLDSQHTAQMSVLQEVLTKIGKRYFYVERNHHQNWFCASKSCVEMGGQLAVIQDEQELRDLRRRITHDTS
nr:accessory gland protein Acp29AB-like [Drosophila suzukii]